MNLCNLGELQMEDKEKKQMLTTELTKEKSGRSAGMIQDMSINGIKLHLAQNGTGGPVIFWGMYPHQQNEVEHLWESLLELVPEQNFLLVPARCISGGELESGLFALGSSGGIREGRLRRTRSEDAEMADRGMCATY
ncbi:MAG: hypothetical protein V8R24_05605 [Dorea longicatena]